MDSHLITGDECYCLGVCCSLLNQGFSHTCYVRLSLISFAILGNSLLAATAVVIIVASYSRHPDQSFSDCLAVLVPFVFQLQFDVDFCSLSNLYSYTVNI